MRPHPFENEHFEEHHPDKGDGAKEMDNHGIGVEHGSHLDKGDYLSNIFIPAVKRPA
jgi:hypothetical protein